MTSSGACRFATTLSQTPEDLRMVKAAALGAEMRQVSAGPGALLNLWDAYSCGSA